MRAGVAESLRCPEPFCRPQENDVPRNTLVAPGRSEMLPVLENHMEMTQMKSCRTYPHHSATDSTETSPAPPRLLYSRKECAYQLSLSMRALDYLIAAGRLRTRKIGGR